MAEAELMELFEKASKAARKACTGSDEDGADGTAVIVDASEEERCTDALRAIGALDISTTLLLSTQVHSNFFRKTYLLRSRLIYIGLHTTFRSQLIVNNSVANVQKCTRMSFSRTWKSGLSAS